MTVTFGTGNEEYTWEETMETPVGYTTNNTRLVALLDAERAYRQATSERRCFPDAADCCLFAATEAAEYAEALLRMNPAYGRNNEKSYDAVGELGDLVQMILATMIRAEEGGKPVDDVRLYAMGLVFHTLGSALTEICYGTPRNAISDLEEAFDAVADLAMLHGVAVKHLLADKHAAGLAKWGAEVPNG